MMRLQEKMLPDAADVVQVPSFASVYLCSPVSPGSLSLQS